MRYLSDFEAKQMICEYGRRLYARGLVSANEGNISQRVGENEVWVTPTYESKGFLNPDMLIKMDLDGNILESTPYEPSSEVKMHLGVYREDTRIMSVIHAHPITATAYACTRERVRTDLVPETIAALGKEIQVIPFGMPGTYELPEQVRPYVRANRFALLANHGALAWGESLKDAYYTMEMAENYCKMYTLATKIIGNTTQVPKAAVDELMVYYDELGE